VAGIQGGKIRLAIEAPHDVPVDRHKVAAIQSRSSRHRSVG
jgi:sRNA-binding carbon storage regulator CsrA